MLATALMTLIFSVVGIELTLHWNSISGVYTINSTGQLIPFVIGLLGLLKILYKPFLLVCYNHTHIRSLTDKYSGVNDIGPQPHQKEAMIRNQSENPYAMKRVKQICDLDTWILQGLLKD
jgi:hypothetical protein